MKTLQELQVLILNWAKEKDLLKSENAPKQRLKLLEEVGETAGAILKNNTDEIKDGIGDIFVVLVILAEQLEVELSFEKGVENKNDVGTILFRILELSFDSEEIDIVESTDWLNDLAIFLNLDLTECANLAWNEIKDRKGNTINGTFIKN